MIRNIDTTPTKSYCVTVLKAPVDVIAVYKDGTTETIATFNEARQYTFIAMSGETRFSGGEIGKQVLPVPFNSAPAGNGNGGGELTPEQEAALESVTDGSRIESVGPAEGFTMDNNAVFRAVSHDGAIPLAPTDSTTVIETKLILQDTNVPATPLLTVPDGVTLHWAGDEEPTWEAGKDYVIQLLQTAPTRIEARLFNAPQGAKLPDWMTDSARGYVAWSYNAAGKKVPVAANVSGQTNGALQFLMPTDTDSYNTIAAELSSLLETATFAEQTSGYKQFYGVKGDLSLPYATFENETDARYQFEGLTRVNLPYATFENVKDVTHTFGSVRRIYAPRATFRNIANGLQSGLFILAGEEGAWLNAFNPASVVNVGANGWFNAAKGNFYFFSWKLNAYQTQYLLFASSNSTAYLYLPVLTFSGQSNAVKCFYGCGGFYVPHLNLIALSSAPDFWRGKGGMPLDMLRQVVYGPKLVDGAPSATTYDDEEGIKQMIDPAEVQGERMLTNGNKPTGWGIRDYRVTDAATGEFVLDGAGNYTYESTGHTIAFDAPATSQGDADYEACLTELENRGWVAELTYI